MDKTLKKIYKLIQSKNLIISSMHLDIFENHIKEFLQRAKNIEVLNIDMPKNYLDGIKSEYLEIALEIVEPILKTYKKEDVLKEAFLIATHFQLSNG